MGFEYDPAKSAENKRKHGIDFDEAQALWGDDALIEIPARVVDEPWLVIGRINDKHWSAVITRRPRGGRFRASNWGQSLSGFGRNRAIENFRSVPKL